MAEPQLIGHVLFDLIADIWRQGDRDYWLRRATEFDKVGTPACDEIAQACRNRATMTEFADAELQDVLEDLLRNWRAGG